MPRQLYYTFVIIGIIFALYYLSKIIYKIYALFFRKGYDLLKRYNGGWAIITGATDGIGLAYCY